MLLRDNIDVFTFNISVDLMKRCLPFIQCLDDNFKSVEEEEIKTNKAFWKGMYNILDNQLRNRVYLRTKVLETQQDLLQVELNQQTKSESEERMEDEPDQISSATKNP